MYKRHQRVWKNYVNCLFLGSIFHWKWYLSASLFDNYISTVFRVSAGVTYNTGLPGLDTDPNKKIRIQSSNQRIWIRNTGSRPNKPLAFQVKSLKQKIESEKGASDYSAVHQKLIYAGKILGKLRCHTFYSAVLWSRSRLTKAAPAASFSMNSVKFIKINMIHKRFILTIY